MANNTNRRLSDKQYAAIHYLALPKRGGLTYEQVAQEVGISDRQMRDWRKDDDFNEELKAQIALNIASRLAVIESVYIDHTEG